MAVVDPHYANDFPGDPFYPILHQPHDPALPRQNHWVPRAPDNGQPEGHWEDMPPPVRDAAGPGGVQDPHRFNAVYQGVVGHHPQQLAGNDEYVFPNVGLAQGIPAQAQPNAPVNLERYPFGYVPQHNAQGPVQAAIPHPFVHRIPIPNQGGAENLRQLAIRYLHRPDAQVGMVSMEPGAAGRVKVVIILDSDDFF